MNGQSSTLGESEAVSILYCHGWGSRFDPRTAKIRALAKMRPVDGITVDYTIQPQVVFEKYANRLKLHPEALVVGTSLGGFFAAWLGAELGRPFIAINPSIAPSKTLRAYVGHGVNYFGEPFELTEGCVTAYDALSFRVDGQGTIILDMGDEILDAQATLDFVMGRLPVVTFEGGSHRFDHMAELIESRPDLFYTC
jgi:predicted esterase YcpF (UPF0227 family)